MPIQGKDRLKAEIREKNSQFVRALVLEGHRRLVQKTPRDTGRGAANWNIGIGSMDTSVDVNATTADIEANVADNARVAEDIEAGMVAYSTNGLPYMPRLNDGWSRQAPAKFVEMTAAELQPVAEQIAVRLRAGNVG